ncbi:MAG: 4-aminobutyrate--2-oxoglutarate transaminase [Candidatus Dadabacteria bacterium]|nr:MAG: 4-aminobutyrate--2-oxoglutarate transaminase [Candidatus Dadabacteria bacterium]
MPQTNQDLMERRKNAVPQGPFNVTDRFAVRARGARVTDADGNEYIDFAGGIGVVGTAHGHPAVLDAVRAQMERFVHTCFHVMPYEPYVRLAEELNRRTPGTHAKKTFFCNSGAEAVENAVKVARALTGRPAVICFENAFHGRTLLGMSLTSKIVPYKKGFGPFAPEVYRIPYAYCYRCAFGAEGPETCGLECAENLRRLFITGVDPDAVAAMVMEPILGEGGFVVPPRAFVTRVAEICREHGIVVVADEVQTGFGRTGTLFASEQFGLVPDVLTTAKAMASGFPLSGVTGRAEILDAPPVGGLGGTYGGNPLSCAAALATLEVIDREDLCGRARALGEKIRNRFLGMKETLPCVGDVRGLGAMMAIELVTDRKTKEPAAELTQALGRFALERGVITIKAGSYGNVVRLLPPLCIEEDDLDRGLDVLEEGLRTLSS